MNPFLRALLRQHPAADPAPAPDTSLCQPRPAATAGGSADSGEPAACTPAQLASLAKALVIRHVDSGSCNGCELEIGALNGPHYRLEALGVRFAASPRHADALLVTGPVSSNMDVALHRAWAAVPTPKRLIAVGDCACTGGIFGENYACRGGVSGVLPVDVAIPGCPPTPERLLAGILAAIAPATADNNAAASEAQAEEKP
ncbi:formate hydrogenlyase [Rhodocyclus tenuis]|uniref:Formate hydrogenlyase n=1 Tax=Rhodocyclus gracilis TaxID=2929842 RepID=A0ABX0WEV8_9RHOO|nr:formate hydrogenlyase [Rhodocyclus gracilis]NJA88259.1 formate hydrogenlyase [Rhodocyclus gracilis]